MELRFVVPRDPPPGHVELRRGGWIRAVASPDGRILVQELYSGKVYDTGDFLNTRTHEVEAVHDECLRVRELASGRGLLARARDRAVVSLPGGSGGFAWGPGARLGGSGGLVWCPGARLAIFTRADPLRVVSVPRGSFSAGYDDLALFGSLADRSSLLLVTPDGGAREVRSPHPDSAFVLDEEVPAVCLVYRTCGRFYVAKFDIRTEQVGEPRRLRYTAESVSALSEEMIEVQYSSGVFYYTRGLEFSTIDLDTAGGGPTRAEAVSRRLRASLSQDWLLVLADNRWAKSATLDISGLDWGDRYFNDIMDISRGGRFVGVQYMARRRVIAVPGWGEAPPRAFAPWVRRLAAALQALGVGRAMVATYWTF